VEALGEDYPYYVPPLHGKDMTELRALDKPAMWKTLKLLMGDAALRQRVGQDIHERAKFYSMEQSVPRLKELFTSFL